MMLSQQDILSGKASIQSPYLALQAAGSDGSDGSSPGLHLRWDFLRTLGDTHLPKGNLASNAGPYPAAGGFNKRDDFVTVLRAPYDVTYPTTLDLRSHQPDTVLETGNTRSWRFNITVNSTPAGEVVTVVLRFIDVAVYDMTRTTVDPSTNALDFIKAYTGVVEVEVAGNLSFAVTWLMEQPQAATPGQLRVETISAQENLASSDVYLSARQTLTIEGIQNASSPSRPIANQVVQLDVDALLDLKKTYGENIRYARFDYTDCFPVAIMLETYRHFINGKITASNWSTLSEDMSLSIDDAVVFQRLEDDAYPVNGQWPRYHGANPVTGLYTANVPNYTDKWVTRETTGDEGLKDLVLQYLDLSRDPNNPTGIRVLHPERSQDDPFDQDTDDDYVFDAEAAPDEVGGIDEGATSIDSLSMIKLIASDFHVARMFGFGYIDADVTDPEQQYIYLALYETTAALETGQAASDVIHVAMSLPTGQKDYRLPVTTVLKPLVFGLQSSSGSTRSITDADGYIPYAAVRIINLHIEPVSLGRLVETFYESSDNFTTDDRTLPVCYGIKYKASTDADWRAPELSNDPEYLDGAGIDETVPLTVDSPDYADVDEMKLFVHTEEEEGLHEYAVYGINWFSRVSGLSNSAQTETSFSLADIATLMPPLNFAVQLIQQEAPTVLTTPVEQTMLQNLTDADPAGDHTLIRATFDWNHSHNIAHQWADKVQLFFRQDPIRIVRGEVKSVTEISTDVVEVRTTSFSVYSTAAVQTYDGRVVEGDESRFRGSLFVSNTHQYVVEEVIQSEVSGEGAVFRIKKLVEGSAQDIDNSDEFIVTDEFIIPSTGERFFVTENMGDAVNWTDAVPDTEQPLTKEIDIVKFSEYQEQVVEYDGTLSTVNIGGIIETATVTEIEDIDDEGTPIPGSHTGTYEIAFDDFVLADHSDTNIEWYRGIARISLAASDEKKVLSVIDIGVHSGTFLKIVASDPEGPGASDTIQTGTGIAVNFHPAYRVYLHTQPDVLTKATTLPATGQRVKQTLMGARSFDTTLGAASTVCTPSILLAREIIIPVPPQQPTGAVFATRPDFYGKATYTFDTVMTTTGGRKPFALVFYRANERAVLDTLYLPETVRAIRAALDNLPEDDAAFYFDRFRDLVTVTLAADGKFKEYISGGYRFPNPDNSNYVVPDPDSSNPAVTPFVSAPDPGTITDTVKAAIEGIFFPLTEQPVFYSAISSGRKTSNRKPVIRDSNGAFLLPTDPLYDPAPMAVVLPETDTVRFTDYTLDGSSKNIYFYFVRELNDLFQFSSPSPVLGPVRLINTFPPEAPGIKKVTTQIEDPEQETTTAVRIAVNAYLPSENITQWQLYRALRVEDASSIRTMTVVAQETLESGSPELFDGFADLDIIPYGDPLFYRVVALREILSENETTAYVPSLPSKSVMATIIDVVNPLAPSLTAEVGIDTGAEFQEVKITWNRTAYNGTYQLFKMTATGNWKKIYETRSNKEPLEYLIPDNLSKLDDEGNRIYHRFKVDVLNSSGLLNLEENTVVL